MEYAAAVLVTRRSPSDHLASVFGRYGRRSVKTPAINYQRVRWATPDQDFIDLDWLHGVPGKPLLVLFHGLEGSSQSHYALAFAEFAKQHGLSYVVPHFRGCSGEINLAPRAYHSGDFEEIDWILRRLRQQHTGAILALGVSLGGNALLRWGQEMGQTSARVVAALASVCAPLDLSISGHAMGRGLNRQIYTRMFLASMKPKAMRKLAQHPGLFSARQCRRPVTFLSLTMSLPHPCMVSRIPMTTGCGHPPNPAWRRYGFRRWWSMRAMTPLSRRAVCPSRRRWGRV
jgi:predicted alpha/beta-fold hydrolase